ncbi:thiamine pyrophosphate-binding protein [Haloechinothrix sp. YIM 98757]|uniref:Thiamine pyrophosphate-binding protein n=1 Tax=Haloechinothrix aidingensis TaxID=2752311 RepID=A0A838AB05_9PSEU|nr:thiamine pyrophosphate-binding protein [Haloechinothrix aidingensis]MBA0126395.1 thiamine pyrophosphate-binding protein [Haloechinothrix aidingensis]
MPESRGGDLLVRLMREHGVDTAFGVVSVHNLPLVEAVAEQLRFVPVRHEAAAVNAADGYARSRGGLGVAITSTGTGAGNAAGAMVEARTAGSPVLHVTGQIDIGYLGQGRGVIHETTDQLGMLTAVSQYAATVTSAAGAGKVLREAAASALTTPTGPSSVEWPIDLQYARQNRAAATTEPIATHPAPASDAVELAASALAAARRPAIWAGGGATAAREQLRELAERTGAAVFTSNSGRGSLPEDHELVVGNFATSAEGARLLADADLLLSVGTHFRSNETQHYALQLPQRHIQVDIEADAIGRVYPATVGLHGPSDVVLSAILARFDERPPAPEPAWRGRVVETRNAVREQLREAIGPYAVICDELRDRLPREAPIARDVTIPSSQWGNRLLEIYRPETNLFPVGGGIGQGLATGIGAAIQRPGTPTAVIAGDGGLAVHLGELATLAQERPWLVLLVFNDGGYGVLRNMQQAHSGRSSGVDLFTPDFGRLCRSLDLPHALVNRVEKFPDALADALDRRGPSVIEVDVTALGPTPVPFVPPVHVPDDS